MICPWIFLGTLEPKYFLYCICCDVNPFRGLFCSTVIILKRQSYRFWLWIFLLLHWWLLIEVQRFLMAFSYYWIKILKVAYVCYGDISYHTLKMDSSNLNIFSELSSLGGNNSFLTRHLTDGLQAEHGSYFLLYDFLFLRIQ